MPDRKVPVPITRAELAELPNDPPHILLRVADEHLRSAWNTHTVAGWGSSTLGATLQALTAIVAAKAEPAGRARSIPKPTIWKLAATVAPELAPAIGRLKADILDLPDGPDLLREIQDLIDKATQICSKTYT